MTYDPDVMLGLKEAPTKGGGEAISLKEVADLLGVTKQTILNWVERGILSTPDGKGRRGSPLLFSRREVEDIKAFLDQPLAMKFFPRDGKKG